MVPWINLFLWARINYIEQLSEALRLRMSFYVALQKTLVYPKCISTRWWCSTEIFSETSKLHETIKSMALRGERQISSSQIAYRQISPNKKIKVNKEQLNNTCFLIYSICELEIRHDACAWTLDRIYIENAGSHPWVTLLFVVISNLRVVININCTLETIDKEISISTRVSVIQKIQYPTTLCVVPIRFRLQDL